MEYHTPFKAITFLFELVNSCKDNTSARCSFTVAAVRCSKECLIVRCLHVIILISIARACTPLLIAILAISMEPYITKNKIKFVSRSHVPVLMVCVCVSLFQQQLSQFWYNEQTATALANEVLQASHNRRSITWDSSPLYLPVYIYIVYFFLRIACISCPTLFAKLIEVAQSRQLDCEAYLLEYDRRFEIYGSSFAYYDYNDPLTLPQPLVAHSFGIVVADPPFLSEECLCKVAQTIKFLAQDKVILCTGICLFVRATCVGSFGYKI